MNIIQFQESFFTNYLKFYTLLCILMNRPLKDLEKKLFICFIWVRHEEENAFQSFNVGKDLKWNMLLTKFHKFYHDIKVWWVG